MKNILVSYTLQEKDEATGNYIPVNHKGKFHSVSMDKNLGRKRRYAPKTKNNHEINRRNHKGVNTNRKGTNLNIYDR